MNSEQDVGFTDGSEVELCCRVCLQLEDLMVPIYDDGLVEDLQSDLVTLLERCGGVKVFASYSFKYFQHICMYVNMNKIGRKLRQPPKVSLSRMYS